MATWEGRNKDVQKFCCQSIVALTHFLSSEARVARAFVKLSTVNTITTSLRAFPNAQDMQRHGIGALENLFCIRGKLGEEVAGNFVWKLDGFKTVVKAMTQFPNNALLQHNGCSLFCNIHDLGRFQQEMIESNVLVAVSKASCIHFD